MQEFARCKQTAWEDLAPLSISTTASDPPSPAREAAIPVCTGGGSLGRPQHLGWCLR